MHLALGEFLHFVLHIERDGSHKPPEVSARGYALPITWVELNDDGFTIVVYTADCSVVRHEDVFPVVQQAEGLSTPIRTYDCHVLEIHDSPLPWLLRVL
jgi:hypothetical protein